MFRKGQKRYYPELTVGDLVVDGSTAPATGTFTVGGDQVDIDGFPSNLQSIADGDIEWGESVVSYGSTAANSAYAVTHGSSGTNQVALANGNTVWSHNYYASDGTDFTLSAKTKVKVDGTVSAGKVPTSVTIQSADSTGTMRDRAVFQSNGLTKLVLPGADNAPGLTPGALQVLDGSVAVPITTKLTPTVQIGRTENITDDLTSDGSNGPALYVSNSTFGTQQGVAVTGVGYALPAAVADVVGVYGIGSQNGTAGTHSSFGGFFIGSASTAGSGALGIQTGCENLTGTDQAYDPATQLDGTPFMVGIDVAYNSSPSKLSQAGILLRSNVGNMDVGLAFLNGVNSADIRTDTTSVTILYAGATAHTNGINLANATFSGSPILAPLMTPASSAAAGTQGAIKWDANYIYICTAANTWKRVALVAF